MKSRDLLIVSLFVAAAFVAFAFATAARMPEGADLPIHWNAAGQPDGFAPALQALLMPAAVLLVLSAIFTLIPFLEPLQDRLAGSAPILRMSWIGMILLMTIIEAVIGLPAWGITLPVNAVMLGIGLLLLMIGNVLPKSRPGFFVGIRTPWTITDTDNWIATHRLGGKAMMLAGLVIIIASILPISPEITAAVVLVSALGAAIVPITYSWWFWRQKKAASNQPK